MEGGVAMLRWISVIGILAVGSLVAPLEPTRTTHSIQPADEFWRVPWNAGVSRIVSGYGYREGTHSGVYPYAPEDRWALDFQATEGEFVVATQEGNVTLYDDTVSSCGPTLHYGEFVEVTDIGGFVHRYAHLSDVAVGYEHVLPGQIIGRAGSTGNVLPCPGGAHLHFRITDPDGNPCVLGYCIPEPMSGFCAGYPINCRYPTPFSADPSSDLDPDKTYAHLSNNAGVGYRPYSGSPPVTNDAIVERYYDEGGFHENWSERIVGKPTNPYGAGRYSYLMDERTS